MPVARQVRAPLALLSACGQDPAYGKRAIISKNAYTLVYNEHYQEWHPLDDSKESDEPADLHAGTYMSGSDYFTQYCETHHCRFAPISGVAKPWPVIIPVPNPLPAPGVGSHVIYASQYKQPSLMLKQIGVIHAP